MRRSMPAVMLVASVIVAGLSLLATQALAAFAAPPVDQPGIFGADDRKVIGEKAQARWNAVGRLNRDVGGFCTAVLIGRKEVLTAAHCLWDERRKRWLQPGMIHFVPGYRRGQYLGHARGTRFRMAERIGMDEYGRPKDPVDDWAVVTLDLDLEAGAGIHPLRLAGPMARAGLYENTSLLRVGYGRDRPHLPVLVDPCRALGSMEQGRLLLHDCDATLGDSGSPVMAMRDGKPVVLGVHSSIIQLGGHVAGIAVFVERQLPVDALLPRQPAAGN